jgi:alkylation response protein AidB-like acyl-CoA dehydrogenase
MNFESDPRDAGFRAEVRTFIGNRLPELFPGLGSDASLVWGFNRPYMQKWVRALNEKGWAVPHWPIEWGGKAWPPTWRSILEDEMMAADCPPADVIGTGFVGPVIYTFGNEEQKSRFLPRIRNGDDFWCQGFSEAEAGSDVMSLRTACVREGPHFIVTGQKMWISNAHNADMMFALARIDSPGNRRQQGLSFLLIDMHAPGISVHPIITIDGIHRVNEVVLDNVLVPVENLVGEQGKGWIYARFLLARERTIVAGLPMLLRLFTALRTALCTERYCGAPLLEDPCRRLQLAQFEGELNALKFLELRILHARDDDADVEVLASMLKLRGSELRQRLCEAVWDAFGESGLELSARTGAANDSTNNPGPGNTHWSVVNHLFARSATIVGGTSEILRNIIAGVSLGL